MAPGIPLVDREKILLHSSPVNAITSNMPSDADALRRDLPAVPHATLRCTCSDCIAARQAEVRRRIEDARREERRGRELAVLEAMSGPVYSRLGMPRKATPGTREAIVRRYGRRAS